MIEIDRHRAPPLTAVTWTASVPPTVERMTGADPLRDLGVRLTPGGGEIRVWSAHATAVDLVIFDDTDLDWIVRTVPLEHDGDGVWSARTRSLAVGTRYALRADGPNGPTHAFDASRFLLDPWGTGLVRRKPGVFRSAVPAADFDFGGVEKPRIPLERTVVYEAHVKGLTRLSPHIPEELRGSYAGLAHPSTIETLLDLGVTTIELLPIHAFVSEQRLIKQGLTNYWGYNTLNFFTPHAAYASKRAQADGPSAVLREVKGMVKLLHEAGLEVVLDVVYNHTAEEGPGGPTTSLRGLDNASYYRQTEAGHYIDTAGTGNTVNFATEAAQRLVIDSLSYWANDVQVDGFRFDLAPALGRDGGHEYRRDHPLLRRIVEDPRLVDTKMIAEPWDTGMGGWQTGNFPDGWHEWNDRYRDRVRNFWLSDVDYARRADHAPAGIGGFATRLTGSSNTFSPERGPLASVNFVTAHDGFTLADLVSYDVKHNTGNGESNRDGSDNNRSFNHGTEGDTDDETVLATRRKAMRNLMGTLLLSAGVPMITAGDEYGRSQRGNNNPYCHDSELTWMSHSLLDWQIDLREHTRALLRLRAENPALRPTRFGGPGASRMDWFDAQGARMSDDEWTRPDHRTMQYLATSTTEVDETVGDAHEPNRTLLIVHGMEHPTTVSLPTRDGIARYDLLWSSADERPVEAGTTFFAPGDSVDLPGTCMVLLRAAP
jgi:glycogen operon protein